MSQGSRLSTFFLFSLASCSGNFHLPIFSDATVDTRAVSISNLHDGAKLQTGFLVGVSRSLTAVGVELDGAAPVAATGTDTWRFALPHGSQTWARGSAHTIRVGDLVGGALTGPITTLHVVKDANSDFNGDGYPDFATGSSVFQSPVYVFYSHPSGFPANVSATAADAILTPEGGGTFSASIAIDDINGDGYADIAVGDMSINSSRGKVYVYYSRGQGGLAAATIAATSADAILAGQVNSTQFGTYMTIGDVNRDGYADLVISSDPFVGVNSQIFIFHSAGDSGIASQPCTSANSIITAETTGDWFGRLLLLADVNGDGYLDLITQSHLYPGVAAQGRVYVFHGSASGYGATVGAGSAHTVITGENSGDYFGYQIAVGDLNGDGLPDLLATAIHYGSQRGRAYAFLSTGSNGFGTSIAAASAATIITGENNNDNLGIRAAVADFDGDGRGDIVVTAPQYATDTGRAYVFQTGGSALPATLAAGSASRIITGENANDELGWVMTTGDIDGDGRADLLVSAYGYNGGFGRVYGFLSGQGTGIPSGTASFTLTGESASTFGYSLAIRDTKAGYPANVLVGAFWYLDGSSNPVGRVYAFSPIGVSAGTDLGGASATTIFSGDPTQTHLGGILTPGDR